MITTKIFNDPLMATIEDLSSHNSTLLSLIKDLTARVEELEKYKPVPYESLSIMAPELTQEKSYLYKGNFARLDSFVYIHPDVVKLMGVEGKQLERCKIAYKDYIQRNNTNAK